MPSIFRYEILKPKVNPLRQVIVAGFNAFDGKFVNEVKSVIRGRLLDMRLSNHGNICYILCQPNDIIE